MASVEERIANFQRLVEANPEDGLSYFSLGQAQLDAGQTAEAIVSFERALELKLDPSRIYQLLGGALLKAGKKEAAIGQLTRGAKMAAARGDFMPKDEMVKMLEELGAPVPEEARKKVEPQAAGGETVQCARCGKAGPKLPKPPFGNDQGRMIQERICANCWREWISMGTNIINHMRLPLNDPQSQRIFEEKMLEFLNLESVRPNGDGQ